ncbi:enoyl-CoA hydratase/isomerase family protein [Thermodesulfobacteriota bacterium]
MKDESVVLEKRGHICVLTINRPPANAWNLAILEAFESGLDEVENDGDLRAIILTGAGEKCFSAGFDVSDAAHAEKTGRKVERESVQLLSTTEDASRRDSGLSGETPLCFQRKMSQAAGTCSI